MPNTDPLVWFGFVVIAVTGLCIVVPFLRGKSDLLTSWNTLLLGTGIFVGLAAIEANFVPQLPYQELNWFQPTAKEVSWFMWACSAFVATLLLAFYYNGPAKRFAQKRFAKWPELTTPVTFLILGACSAVMFLSVIFRHVVFLAPLFFNLALVCSPAVSVFSFALWYKNRINFAWLLLFLALFSGVSIYAMVVSGGRRLLMSVFLGPVLVAYGVNVKYWGKGKILLTLALAGILVTGVGIVYSKFRYYSAAAKERSATGIVSQMRDLRKGGDLFSVLSKGPLRYFAQDTAHYSLLLERYMAQGTLTQAPLNSLKFVLTYPIPRKLWPRKPEPIGISIARDAAHLRGNNWGVGIAGHAAYEGGIPVIMIYALLLAFGARLLDEPLRLQPENPFLICMLAAVFPHVIGIPRGDMGT